MIFFSIYLCLIYSLLYGFFFAYPIVFVRGHGFNDGQVGLCFVRFVDHSPRVQRGSPCDLQFGIFIGIVICGAIACPFQERYYLRKVKEGNGTTVPESRLPLMMVGSIVLPISLFIFAWTSMPHVSWVGPAVAGVPFGFALIAIYISANVYLVDVYSNFAASALAAKTLARSLVGASVPLWIEYEYAALGNAWAGSVFAFVALAMVPSTSKTHVEFGVVSGADRASQFLSHFTSTEHAFARAAKWPPDCPLIFASNLKHALQLLSSLCRNNVLRGTEDASLAVLRLIALSERTVEQEWLFRTLHRLSVLTMSDP